MERQELKAMVKELLMNAVKEETSIPIGVSNRHIHLTEQAYNRLFPHEPIKVKKMLKQTGEFAAEQTVSLVSRKGEIRRVRILGPFRKQTQVELSRTDARQLGLDVPIRLSGDIKGTPGITIKSNHAELELSEGVIIAKRHIHMSPDDARRFGVKHEEEVRVHIHSEQRPLTLEKCSIRVGDKFKLEMHIDTDEANAADIGHDATATIVN